MTETEIKGHAIRTTFAVIDELFGAAIQQQVVEGLSDDFRSAFQAGAIVSSGWYPIGWYRQFHIMLNRLLPGEPRIPQRLGRITTERDLAGIYRFILKLTSPALLARHFDKVVSSYLRGGTVRVDARPKEFLLEGHQWDGMSTSLWEEARSGFEVILGSTGVKSIASQLEELGPGHVRMHFSWM
jgi:hypothetical protein